jgi:1-acyl-sn-glycerol-3-phosphate acyltransferase
MSSLLRFAVLASIKALSRLFYRFKVEWVGDGDFSRHREIRVCAILNHTSLFEPIFLGVTPLAWLWTLADRGLIPGADTTLNRPLAGRFFKAMAPEVVPVTRARDKTWRDFISRLKGDTVVLMAPEGRMMRRGGKDRHGQPMSMRGGIADVLERVENGSMLLVYSGGLHHVQAPGDRFPRLFKTVRARFELVPIPAYKKKLGCGTPEFRERVMADLTRRRDEHCRWPLPP